MIDNDNETNEHEAINQLIRDKKNEFTLADPFEFDKCLKSHLGLSSPGRDDQKPLLQILTALEDKSITDNQLSELRKAFCESLAVTEGQ